MNEDANVDSPSNTCDPRLIESLDRLAACIEDLRQWTAKPHFKEGAEPSASRQVPIGTSESAHDDSAVPTASAGPDTTAEETEAIEDNSELEDHLRKSKPSTRECSQPGTPLPDPYVQSRQVVSVPDELLDSFWRLASIDKRNKTLKKCFAEFPWKDEIDLSEALGKHIVIGSSDLKGDWFSYKLRDLDTAFPVPCVKHGPPYHTWMLDFTYNDEMAQRRLEQARIEYRFDFKDVVWHELIRKKIEEAWPRPATISARLVETFLGTFWWPLHQDRGGHHGLPFLVQMKSGRQIYDPKSNPNSRLSIIRLCNLVSKGFSVLPIETIVFFTNLFLVPPQNKNFKEFRNIGIQCVSPFISSVQCGRSSRRCTLYPRIKNFIVWDIRAGRVANERDDLKFKDATGFPIYRDTGWIGNSDKSNGFHFREWLCTICVYTRREAGTATGVVLSWIDGFSDSRMGVNNGNGYGYIGPCGRDGETYALFIRKISWVFGFWHETWCKTMDKIDCLINLKPSDTMNQERWKTLMFDSAFQISEMYFSILQMLRIFSDWIKEVEEDLPQLYIEVKRAAAALRRSCTEDELKIREFDLDQDLLSKNLEVLDARIKIYIRDLESRIERKKVEVESLRDGLFNAASLREAVTARTLNLFVIVFTVITVIYTPLGFLATLWSMSNLSNELDGNASTTTPESFISSWIILPLGTYLSSVIFLFIAWVKTSPNGGLYWSRTLKRCQERWARAQERLKDFQDWMTRVIPLKKKSPCEDEERVNPQIGMVRGPPPLPVR